MIKLFLLLMVLSLFSCKSKFSQKDKSENIQLCLNHIYTQKDEKYLEKSRLVLVKDSISEGLDNLHFGKSKIVLKQVAPSDIEIFGYPDVDTSVRHLKIRYTQTDVNKVIIVIELSNVNTWYTYYLKRNGGKWSINRWSSEMS